MGRKQSALLMLPPKRSFQKVSSPGTRGVRKPNQQVARRSWGFRAAHLRGAWVLGRFFCLGNEKNDSLPEGMAQKKAPKLFAHQNDLPTDQSPGAQEVRGLGSTRIPTKKEERWCGGAGGRGGWKKTNLGLAVLIVSWSPITKWIRNAHVCLRALEIQAHFACKGGTGKHKLN